MIPEYLDSDCQPVCQGDCAKAVKVDPATGRWFITMSHPGFNSRANNHDGYATRAKAEAASRRYGSR
jgi:hypothetical protein